MTRIIPPCAHLSNEKGFTLVELMMSMLIIALLATMGIVYLGDVRDRSGDSQAFTEGRHLMTAVSDALLGGEDVVFGDDITTPVTGAIGDTDTNGNSRPPIFSISPDVQVRIDGSNTSAPGDAAVEFWVSSTRGTGKEFLFFVDEQSGQLITADF